MVEIPGFEQYQLVIGCKHDRTFSFDNCSGVITDYILGETGADGSPIPADFYKQVRVGDGSIEIASTTDRHKFTVTRDRLVLAESSGTAGEPFAGIEGALARAQHLFPGTLAFLNKPQIHFLGFVFDFARTDTSDRERFRHPAAESLANKVLSFDLTTKEHPSEFDLRLVFRKQLVEGFLHKGLNDFANIHLYVKDKPTEQVWDVEKESEDESGELSIPTDNPRTIVLSVDIQRMLDPRRELTDKVFEDHWKYSKQFMAGRFKTLIGELGLGTQT